MLNFSVITIYLFEIKQMNAFLLNFRPQKYDFLSEKHNKKTILLSQPI